jgi:hypothetical protein
MRFPFAAGILALALAGAVWIVSRQPEIRVLFDSTTPSENPLDFLDRLPELRAPQETPPPVPGTPRAAGAGRDREAEEAPIRPEDDPAPEVVNQVANDEVARVLMRILAARGLADGISIAVTDREVAIHGAVSTSEQRDQILEVVEGGREARRIGAENLTVRSAD